MKLGVMVTPQRPLRTRDWTQKGQVTNWTGGELL